MQQNKTQKHRKEHFVSLQGCSKEDKHCFNHKFTTKRHQTVLKKQKETLSRQVVHFQSIISRILKIFPPIFT